MGKEILRVVSGFDSDGFARLVIPNGAESVALRFYETNEIGPDPTRRNATVAVVLLVDDDLPTHGTHNRDFKLVDDGQDPPNVFRKYIATFPRGNEKRITHVIELGNPDPLPPSLNMVLKAISDLSAKVDLLVFQSGQLVSNEGVIMAVLDDLEAKVASVQGVEASAAVLLQTIHDELVAALASNNPVRIQAVVDQLGASSDALAAAVAANPDPAVVPTP